MAMAVHALPVLVRAYLKGLTTVPVTAVAFPGLLDRVMCLSPFSDSPYSPYKDGSIFDLQKITGKLLKRIPNACRLRAAIAFQKCLHHVISNGKMQDWLRLLLFRSCIRMPPRTGRKHKLATRVAAQIDFFLSEF